MGSLFGIVLANKLGLVQRVYQELKDIEGTKVTKSEEPLNDAKIQLSSKNSDDTGSHDQEDATPLRNTDGQQHMRISEAGEVLDENTLNFGTVKKIVLFWVLTVPVAMGVSYGLTKLLLINVTPA